MSVEFTVIVPTYNREKVLERALQSVAKQSLAPAELLIVDDGSTDSTPQILESFIANQPNLNIRVLTQENQGVSAARNNAIKEARGAWICFLDSDDEWLPHKLSNQASFIESHPENLIVHGEEIWIRNGVRVNAKIKHKKSGGRIFRECVPLCVISPSTVAIKKVLFERHGLFREDFPVCEDYDLWLRLSSIYEVGFINSPLITKYGGHEDQLSRRYKAMDYWRVKALLDIYRSDNLSVEESEVALNMIKEKCDILAKGYRKHENFEKEAEMKIILKNLAAL